MDTLTEAAIERHTSARRRVAARAENTQRTNAAVMARVHQAAVTAQSREAWAEYEGDGVQDWDLIVLCWHR